MPVALCLGNAALASSLHRALDARGFSAVVVDADGGAQAPAPAPEPAPEAAAQPGRPRVTWAAQSGIEAAIASARPGSRSCAVVIDCQRIAALCASGEVQCPHPALVFVPVGSYKDREAMRATLHGALMGSGGPVAAAALVRSSTARLFLSAILLAHSCEQLFSFLLFLSTGGVLRGDARPAVGARRTHRRRWNLGAASSHPDSDPPGTGPNQLSPPRHEQPAASLRARASGCPIGAARRLEATAALFRRRPARAANQNAIRRCLSLRRRRPRRRQRPGEASTATETLGAARSGGSP